jgi:hypothetical protein
MAKKKIKRLSDDQLVGLATVCRQAEFHRAMVKKLLKQKATWLMESACELYGIRELGRITGLSSTYLSQVRHGNVPLSPGACRLIVKVLQAGRKKQKI